MTAPGSRCLRYDAPEDPHLACDLMGSWTGTTAPSVRSLARTCPPSEMRDRTNEGDEGSQLGAQAPNPFPLASTPFSSLSPIFPFVLAFFSPPPPDAMIRGFYYEAADRTGEALPVRDKEEFWPSWPRSSGADSIDAGARRSRVSSSWVSVVTKAEIEDSRSACRRRSGNCGQEPC